MWSKKNFNYVYLSYVYVKCVTLVLNKFHVVTKWPRGFIIPALLPSKNWWWGVTCTNSQKVANWELDSLHIKILCVFVVANALHALELTIEKFQCYNGCT